MEPGTPDKYADFKPGDDCQPDQQNGTWIMQAHEWGKYVGRAQFDYQNGKLTLTQYDLIPVNLKDADGAFIQEEITKDPELYNTLLTYQEKGQQELGVVIGSTDGVLDGERANVRNKQTNLGRLITTATAEKLGRKSQMNWSPIHRPWTLITDAAPGSHAVQAFGNHPFVTVVPVA